MVSLVFFAVLKVGMFKSWLCYLLALISLSAYSSERLHKKNLIDFTNNKRVECDGEPVWRLSLPVEGDAWLSGRLSALAEAGFARLEQGEGGAQWWLTPANAGGRRPHGDSCYGRMLIDPSLP